MDLIRFIKRIERIKNKFSITGNIVFKDLENNPVIYCKNTSFPLLEILFSRILKTIPSSIVKTI